MFENGRLLFQFRLHDYLPGIWTVTCSAAAPIHTLVVPEEGWLVTGCRKVLDHQLRCLFR